MLELILSVVLIALIGADLVMHQLINRDLRKRLLELATKHAAKTSFHEITITCDNSQAIASLEQVNRVIDHTHARLQDIERRAAALH